MVQFSGQDVDLLLANKAELMLALEHLTLEILDVPSDEHALLCFDANDYRVMRIEELRMTAQTAAACLPAGALARLPVMLQVSTLMLFEARRDGFDAAFGQDMMLLAQAKAEGRPVQSLESVEEQLAAMEPAAAELPTVVDSSLKQLQTGQVRGPLRKMADAWARADMKTLADYPRWCGCADTPAERAWFKRINDDRNVQLAERIGALHGAGQRLLVGVGALHMSGPQALPTLLAQQGFTVEAVHLAK